MPWGSPPKAAWLGSSASRRRSPRLPGSDGLARPRRRDAAERCLDELGRKRREDVLSLAAHRVEHRLIDVPHRGHEVRVQHGAHELRRAVATCRAKRQVRISTAMEVERPLGVVVGEEFGALDARATQVFLTQAGGEVLFRRHPQEVCASVTTVHERREQRCECTVTEMRFSIRRWDLMMAAAGLVHAKGVGFRFQARMYA